MVQEKSTTIECILGTKQADAGRVRLLGQDPSRQRRTLFQRIGVQFQEGDYQKEIRVSELCEETASLYRSPADWRKLCEQFGIGDTTKHTDNCDRKLSPHPTIFNLKIPAGNAAFII